MTLSVCFRSVSLCVEIDGDLVDVGDVDAAETVTCSVAETVTSVTWVFLKTVDLSKEQNVTVPYSVFRSCFIPFWV